MYSDILIIGAGVVGACVARELSKYKASITVLESGYDVCSGASKANSGIVHAGYDAKPGTLKAKLNIDGSAMFESLCNELGAPYKKIGALLLAFSSDDEAVLQKLLKQGLENSLHGLEIISGEKAREMEPQVSSEVSAALNVPMSAITSPYELTYLLCYHAAQNGVKFLLNTKAETLNYNKNLWHVKTNNGDFTAKVIINCAGVFADEIHNQISPVKYKIIPRKGEYFLLDRKEPLLFTRTIFQTPNDMGKGVLVSPTCHGNIILGPSSDDIENPEDVSTNADILAKVFQKAKLTWAEATKRNVITTFAGVRAHEQNGDFVIGEVEGTSLAFEALGIESPGLSASPAIAKMLENLVVKALSLQAKDSFKQAVKAKKSFHNMSLEERKQAIMQNPAYGKIVCRCEQVTEAEIIDAIHSPVGATTIDGVKRRTRAGMGRCQGGFCSPRVIELLAQELNKPISDISKFGGRSVCFIGKIENTALKGDN